MWNIDKLLVWRVVWISIKKIVAKTVHSVASESDAIVIYLYGVTNDDYFSTMIIIEHFVEF